MSLVDVFMQEGVLSADAVLGSGILRQAFIGVADFHIATQVCRLVFQLFQATCRPEVHAQGAQTLLFQLLLGVSLLGLFGFQHGNLLFSSGLGLFLGHDARCDFEAIIVATATRVEGVVEDPHHGTLVIVTG